MGERFRAPGQAPGGSAPTPAPGSRDTTGRRIDELNRQLPGPDRRGRHASDGAAGRRGSRPAPGVLVRERSRRYEIRSPLTNCAPPKEVLDPALCQPGAEVAPPTPARFAKASAPNKTFPVPIIQRKALASPPPDGTTPAPARRFVLLPEFHSPWWLLKSGRE